MIKIVLIILGVIVTLIASVCLVGNIAFTKKAKGEAKEIFRDGEEILPEIVIFGKLHISPYRYNPPKPLPERVYVFTKRCKNVA